MADTKKEYTSNLHPKGDMDTTVYPNVKSENIIDKDTTAYTAGKVPDSSLVSKSLDDLNEKIETNKIQTETNKTNIATLQVDVSTLKGNYSSVQSQANTNSSDIALLESNAIKKDTDASLKSLTLPSASDLKTKDGTTFGGGSELYNGAEFLPTFDIATLKDTYLPLVGGTLSGNLDIVKNNIYFSLDNIRNGKMGTDRATFSETPRTSTGPNYFYILGLYDSPKLRFKYNEAYISYSNLTYMGIDTSGITISNARYDGTIQLLAYDLSSGELKHKFVMKSNALPAIDDSPIITQATLANDLDAKQSTLYRHTVLISEPTNKTAYLAFTAESEKNTPIDSIQNLIAVFGNTSIACSGLYRDSDPSNEQSLLMINVGTSISDTTISSATISNSAITDFSNALFTDIFGSTGFTITDNVTAM